MKTFKCNCKDRPTLFFESNHCSACGRTVGLDDRFRQVEPYDMDEESGHFFKAAHPEVRYQKCDNNAQYKVCNGMVNLTTFVPSDDSGDSPEILCTKSAKLTKAANTVATTPSMKISVRGTVEKLKIPSNASFNNFRKGYFVSPA